jgi:hypothetical protein
VAGPTPAPSLLIHETEVTHHRAPAHARALLSAAAHEMRQTVGPDPDLGLYRVLQIDATGPAPTRAALAAARSAVQSLDQPPLHAEDRPRLAGEAVATRGHFLDWHRPLVGNRLLRTQDGTHQHQHRLHLAVIVTGLFLDLLRALLLDDVMTPGVEATRGLPLVAAKRVYHRQRCSSLKISFYSHGTSLSNLGPLYWGKFWGLDWC